MRHFLNDHLEILIILRTSIKSTCSFQFLQEYDCANDGCNLIDQSSFCGTYGGEGCAPADGYY